MEWSQSLIDKLNAALNEATVCGLDYDPERRVARLLTETMALPEHGPMDPDPRRSLVMSPVVSLDVWLRPGGMGELGAAIELESVDALECFFQSLDRGRPAHERRGSAPPQRLCGPLARRSRRLSPLSPPRRTFAVRL
jgi:hypothetical protein